jgi:hypothetical protein
LEQEGTEGTEKDLCVLSVLLFKSVFFPQNEMNEVTRKDLCPQITQMDADEEFWNRRARRERRKTSAFSAFSCSNQFAVSASIHVHPRFNSFGCGCAALRLGRLPVLRCPPEGCMGRARRERRKNSAFSAFSCSNQFAVSASIHVHPQFNSFGCGCAALRLGRLPVLRCPPEGFLGRARFREDAKKLLYFYGHELEPMLNSSA